MKQIEATPESVWAILQENAKQIEKLSEQHAETERVMKESRAEFERKMQESRAEFERKTSISEARWDKEMRNLAKMIGGISTNHGAFAEEYFYNSFFSGKREFFGEKFDDIDKNYVGSNPGEYDILLINGKAIAIIEVKFKAHFKHINEIYKKIKIFRINFPEYESHKIYFGLAAMVFDKDTEKDCINNGIAVIKQVGDTVVISDENLKVF